jgi:hypothetical protein
MHSPDCRPGVAIRFRGYGTGIQYYEIRAASLARHLKPAPRKLRFERCTIRLRRPAAKILDEKSHPLRLLLQQGPLSEHKSHPLMFFIAPL